jgi:hypothetical protein
MKRILAVLLLGVLFIGTVQAQTWENFWQPRPPVVDKLGFATGASTSLLEFKPVISVIATSFTPPAVAGSPWISGLVNAAGPGLSLQSTSQDLAGKNYVDYSGTLSAIFGGSTKESPNVQVSAALMVGAVNNLVSVGVKRDFFTLPDRKAWSILLGTQINLTLN